mgnify:CR=1 FL=1
MKLRELMTKDIICIDPETPIPVAARMLTQYNIGMLPVCVSGGRLRGILTDRDIVTRGLAAGRDLRAGDIMTTRIVAGTPAMEASVAAHLMGREQVRRLPVLENGTLRGLVSLSDLAGNEETSMDAADALGDISSNLSRR